MNKLIPLLISAVFFQCTGCRHIETTKERDRNVTIVLCDISNSVDSVKSNFIEKAIEIYLKTDIDSSDIYYFPIDGNPNTNPFFVNNKDSVPETFTPSYDIWLSEKRTADKTKIRTEYERRKSSNTCIINNITTASQIFHNYHKPNRTANLVILSDMIEQCGSSDAIMGKIDLAADKTFKQSNKTVNGYKNSSNIDLSGVNVYLYFQNRHQLANYDSLRGFWKNVFNKFHAVSYHEGPPQN